LGDLGRPPEQDKKLNRTLNGGEYRRRGAVRFGFGGAVSIFDRREDRVVVHDRVRSDAEPVRVVELGDVSAAGLMHGAEQSLGAFFVDAGDPYRVGDHTPRVARFVRCAGAHDVERC
jgi:hypothetical protein